MPTAACGIIGGGPDAAPALDAARLRALQAQLARLSETVWNRESAVKENDFFCFAHTRHIVFRPPLDATGLRCHARDLRRRRLLPVMAQAAAPCGYAEPVHPKAMLARLAAGRGIDPHTDRGPVNLPRPQDPRAASDQPPGGADGRQRHLPSGGRPRLRGQQPRAPRRLRRRRAGRHPLHLRGVRRCGPGSGLRGPRRKATLAMTRAPAGSVAPCSGPARKPSPS